MATHVHGDVGRRGQAHPEDAPVLLAAGGMDQGGQLFQLATVGAAQHVPGRPFNRWVDRRHLLSPSSVTGRRGGADRNTAPGASLRVNELCHPPTGSAASLSDCEPHPSQCPVPHGGRGGAQVSGALKAPPVRTMSESDWIGFPICGRGGVASRASCRRSDTPVPRGCRPARTATCGSSRPAGPDARRVALLAAAVGGPRKTVRRLCRVLAQWRTMTDFELVAAADIPLMQGLAQRVTAARPDLISADASYGELAWVWGQGRALYGATWPRRLWFSGDELVAWGWVFLPRQVRRNDGSVTDV